MRSVDARSRGRRGRTALAVAVALFAVSCGGSDGGTGGNDGGGTTEPSGETTVGGENCRTETVEDEYGFEVDIEVCDDE